MSISVNSVSPSNNIVSYKATQKKEKHVDTKTVAAASLAIAGITAMAILALKTKKKPKIKPDGKKPDIKPDAKKPDNTKKPDDVKKPKEAQKTKEPEKVEKPKNNFNKKVADMTEEEKLAFIKEVQAQTDDPVAKAQYAEYIQNGTWDLLN